MTGKLMGLSPKVWIGVAIGGLVLGLWLRHRSSSSGTLASASAIPVDLPATVSSPMGSIDNGVAGGGLPSPSVNTFDPSTVSDLLAGLASSTGAEQVLTEQTQGLTDAIGSLVFAMPSSAGAGSSAAGNGNVNPVTNTPTQPVATRAPAAVTKKPPVKKKTTTVQPLHYYTYKKDVPLKKGQTLHFSAGRGYYGG
jgi:hypothetical protein